MKTFLLLSLALTGLLPNRLLAADENVYHQPTLGITIIKPDAWHFITSEEVLQNLRKTQFEDELLEALVKKFPQKPIVTLTKYKEPYDDLNPSIKVNVKPLRNLSASDPVSILKIASSNLRKAYSNLEYVTKPTETEFADMKAAYLCIDYDLTLKDGRVFPTRSELWVIPRGKLFFMIGIGTRQDEKTGTREEVKNILETMQIAPAEANGLLSKPIAR